MDGSNLTRIRDLSFFADGSYVNLSALDILSSDKTIKKFNLKEIIPKDLSESLLSPERWSVEDFYGDENETTGFSATTY